MNVKKSKKNKKKVNTKHIRKKYIKKIYKKIIQKLKKKIKNIEEKHKKNNNIKLTRKYCNYFQYLLISSFEYGHAIGHWSTGDSSLLIQNFYCICHGKYYNNDFTKHALFFYVRHFFHLGDTIEFFFGGEIIINASSTTLCKTSCLNIYLM